MTDKYQILIDSVKKVYEKQNRINFLASIFSFISLSILVYFIFSLIEFLFNGDENFRLFLYYFYISSYILGFIFSFQKQLFKIFNTIINFH